MVSAKLRIELGPSEIEIASMITGIAGDLSLLVSVDAKMLVGDLSLPVSVDAELP